AEEAARAGLGAGRVPRKRRAVVVEPDEDAILVHSERLGDSPVRTIDAVLVLEYVIEPRIAPQLGEAPDSADDEVLAFAPREEDPPLVPVEQVERAVLFHTLANVAAARDQIRAVDPERRALRIGRLQEQRRFLLLREH